jgi:hypothetical protein
MDGLVDSVYEKYHDAIFEKKLAQQGDMNKVPTAFFHGKVAQDRR